MALESAHAVFLRLKLGAALSAEYSSDARDSLVDNMIRDQGIHTLIQVTPYLFLPPTIQPSMEEIRACTTGLEMRNAIVHAKTKRGNPTVRTYDSDRYRNAIHAVLKVYKILVQELEQNEVD